jgi:hypothetical protein
VSVRGAGGSGAGEMGGPWQVFADQPPNRGRGGLVEVAAVADAMPVADERQRLVARDHVQPGADVEAAAPVVDARRGHADLDAAERVGRQHDGPGAAGVQADEQFSPLRHHG